MSRFFVHQENIGAKSITITDKEDLHHISHVLRLKAGEKIDVSDAIEWEYSALITSIEKDYVEADILDKQKFSREPALKITLFQGLPKQGKMELIIQKAIELGVFEIVPVFTDRSVVTDNGKMGKKIDRWQKIADEAVKQCKRGLIPRVTEDLTFGEMLGRMKEYDLILFPYENEEELTIKQALRRLTDKPGKVGIIIGPEGGFSDREAMALKEKGAVCVTLGKTILRTETAGLAAIAMTMYELEL